MRKLRKPVGFRLRENRRAISPQPQGDYLFSARGEPGSWERGVYAASTCEPSPGWESSDAPASRMVKRRKRRAPSVNTCEPDGRGEGQPISSVPAVALKKAVKFCFMTGDWSPMANHRPPNHE